MNEAQYIEQQVQMRVLKETTESKFLLMQKNSDDKFHAMEKNSDDKFHAMEKRIDDKFSYLDFKFNLLIGLIMVAAVIPSILKFMEIIK